MNGQTAVKPAALGARLGLYAGLACLVFLIALYAVRTTLLISPVILLVFAIVVAFKVAAAYYMWKANRGTVDFKDALQSVFLVSVVSLLLIVFFFYLLFNFIDPTLTEQIKKNISEKTMKSFEEGQITKAQLDAAAERVKSFRLGEGAFFMLYSFSLIVGFFYALVFAGITRLIGRDISLLPPSNS